MSDEAGGAILIGLAVGYFFWGLEPDYIDNLKADEDNEYGESYILTKAGSGQVAVFHGFVDDYSVCDMARQRIQAEGGVYFCSAASMAPERKAWWKFW